MKKNTTTKRRAHAWKFIRKLAAKGQTATQQLVRAELVRKFGMGIDNNAISEMIGGWEPAEAFRDVTRYDSSNRRSGFGSSAQ